MRAFVLFVLLSACAAPEPPSDTTPWEPGPVECPTDVPAAPTVSSADWTPSSPPLGGDVIIFGTSAAAPDRVYAGSGQNGIYRSDDGGFSWTTIEVVIGHIYGQFAVSDTDGDCLAYTSGLPYTSADGGRTMTQVFLDGGSSTIQGLVYDGRRLVMASDEGSVYEIQDCGSSARVIGTLPVSPAPPSSAHSHGQISSNIWMANDGETLYALTNAGVLYASNSGGVTWVTLNTDAAWSNVTLRADASNLWVVRQGTGSFEVQRRAVGGDASAALETVATVAGTATGAYLAPSGEYLVSANFGAWSSERGEISVGVEDEGRGIYSVARVGTALLAGYRAGVAVSPDEGATWGWTSEEMTDLDIVNLHVHPSCANVLFAGTQCRTGTFMSTDWGESWSRVSADMHYTMGVDIAPSDPEQIWAVTDDELYMSTDMGVTWENRYPKGTGVAGAHYHGLGVSPHRPATVLVGSVGSGEYADDTARIYRTDNHGASWSASTTGLPTSTESFHAIHFSDTVPGTVLLGTYRAGGGVSHAGDTTGIGVFRSTDMGNTWTQLTSTDVLSWSQWAECDGHLYAATDGGVLRTDDLGDTWEVLLAPAPDGEVLNVACAGDRVLAVDPAAGIFRSADGGATWEDWTGSIVFDLEDWESQLGLELSKDGSIAYFAHPGQGVFLRGWE